MKHFLYDMENITVQWCIISESMNRDGHGYGGIMGGWGMSLHHTLFAHHKNRSSRFCGACYQFNLERETGDMWYNVINNAGKTYGGEGGHYNVVNNYFKRLSGEFCDPSQPNPSETDNEFVGLVYDSIKSYWYVEGNYVYGNPVVTENNWNGGVKLNYLPLNIRVHGPFASGYIGPEETAEEAFPALNSLPAPDDADHDGMPDEWENINGLDPNNASDRNNISPDGYIIERAESGGGFVVLDTVGPNHNFHVDGTALLSNIYRYRAKAFNATNESLYSDEVYYDPTSVDDFQVVSGSLKICPNPAEEVAHIEFHLNEGTIVDISIIYMNGRLIRKLTDKFYGPGSHTVSWSNDPGSVIKPGIYICTHTTSNSFKALKFTVSN